MKRFAKTIAAVALAGTAAIATPAAAQVAGGIAISSPEAVIVRSQARINAYQQIDQQYSAQIQQIRWVQLQTVELLVMASTKNLMIYNASGDRLMHVVTAAGGDALTLSPMPGLVKSVHVSVGQPVRTGDRLAVLEAMKMEHALTAARDGIVAEVLAAEGQQVEAGAALIRLEEEAS